MMDGLVVLGSFVYVLSSWWWMCAIPIVFLLSILTVLSRGIGKSK